MTVENVEHGEPQQGGEKLQRTLKNRHIQLIAIGGAIGTGLFMGSGKTISGRGPLDPVGLHDHRRGSLPVHAHSR